MTMTVALGDVASLVSGGTPDKRRAEFYEGGTIPWITSADITDGRIAPARTHVTERGIASSAASVAGPGTVLLVTRTGVGKVATAHEALSFSQDITAILPDGKRIDTHYLVHALRWRRPWLEKRARGATIKGVTRDAVSALTFPLPDLGEQRKIASVLGMVQRLQAARHSVSARLRELRASIFAAVAMDAPNSWPVVSVAELADRGRGGIRTGPFGSQLLHSEFVDAGVAVLGIDNAVANEFRWSAHRYISKDKYHQLRRYTVYPGDILITIMGTCGRVAVVPDDIGLAINTKHLCCITLDRSRCLSDYLHAYFMYHPIARAYLLSRAKGAIMAGLNMSIIKQLPVCLPPIEIQQMLAGRLRQVDTVVRQSDAQLRQLDALYTSLQNRAFTGRL